MDIQDLLLGGFTSPHLPLCDYCRQVHYQSRLKNQLPLIILEMKTYKWFTLTSLLPSIASKHGHETKKHVLIGCQTWRVLAPNIWSLTAVKANCHAKGELFICVWSASSAHISFFSTFRHISSSETAHLPPEIILNVLQRIFWWAKTNQVDNTRLLQTSHVWRQNMSCLHPIRTRLFLTCTRLDATDSKRKNHVRVPLI